MILFEQQGFRVSQDGSGNVVVETQIGFGAAAVRHTMDPASAMAMTAKINTACFDLQETDRAS